MSPVKNVANLLEAAKRSHAIYRAYQELMPGDNQANAVSDARQSQSAMQSEASPSVAIIDSKISHESAIDVVNSAAALLTMLSQPSRPLPIPVKESNNNESQQMGAASDVDDLKNLCVELQGQLRELFEWRERFERSHSPLTDEEEDSILGRTYGPDAAPWYKSELFKGIGEGEVLVALVGVSS